MRLVKPNTRKLRSSRHLSKVARGALAIAGVAAAVLAVLAVGVVSAFSDAGRQGRGTVHVKRHGRVRLSASTEVRDAPAAVPRPVSGGLVAVGKEFGDNTFDVRLSGSRGFITVQYRFPPGSATPWHSHSVPLVMAVTAGELTVYYATGSRCARATYSKGQGFIEPPGQIHLVLNDGRHVALAIGSYLGASPRMMQTLATATLHTRPAACPAGPH